MLHSHDGEIMAMNMSILNMVYVEYHWILLQKGPFP